MITNEEQIEDILRRMGKPAAFIAGWVDGEFDGIYNSTQWQKSSLSLSQYAAGFQCGQTAAVEGRGAVLPKVAGGSNADSN